MSDQDLALEFAADDTVAGFRLHRLEFYNWGTFHNRVVTFAPEGRNALLTGDIGSGKSTVVDALNALLVPPARLSFNKAAGADRKERDLRSYVLGYYRSERTIDGNTARPVALRDRKTLSVILAVFTNVGFNQTVTLAQILRMKDGQGQPERMYIVSDGELSIRETILPAAADAKTLRAAVKNLPATDPPYTTFSHYGAAFRRRFGLKSEQALLLFHQTVSMKSVGNLTLFVREHMLEPFDVSPRINALVHHFDDLYRAHQAVVVAKDQIGRLSEIETGVNEYRAADARTNHLTFCRDGVDVYTADVRSGLLITRIGKREEERRRLESRREGVEEQVYHHQSERDRISAAIAANGGDRLDTLRSTRETLATDRDRRVRAYKRYQEIAAAFDLPDPVDSDTFVANRARIEDLNHTLDQTVNDTLNTLTEQGAEVKALKEEHDHVGEEIASLSQRKSNIPARHVAIRDQVASAVGAAPEELPFVGELIRVRPDQERWQGAIERLLHSFGLSLLVPAEHYAEVSAWVNRTHLGQRLMYYRVHTDQRAGSGGFSGPGGGLSDVMISGAGRSGGGASGRDDVLPPGTHIQPDTVAAKLDIKPDCPYLPWLEREIERRFAFTCAETMDAFRRAERAITAEGQIKRSATHHEKDDRYRIGDRTRFILGWTNTDKIALLSRRQADLQAEIADAAARYSATQTEHGDALEQRRNLAVLASQTEFSAVDWRSVTERIHTVDREIQHLTEASDILRTLNAERDAVHQALTAAEAERNRVTEQLTRNDERISHDKELLETDRATLEAVVDVHPTTQKAGATPKAAAVPDADQTDTLHRITAAVDQLRTQIIGTGELVDTPITIENAEKRGSELRARIQARIDAEQKRLRRLNDAITRKMQDFHRDYPVETQEMDASVDAADEYLSFLERLRRDDLPQFEQRFKALLNENTIREIANFQAQLNKESEQIRDRVERINRSLSAIDYEPGRYIRLEAEPTPDQEIRQFRQDLKACTSGTIGADETEQYTEHKFIQVKRIIDRFRGRDGTTELDRRWTQKVTDVRAWYLFAASVRWREDDTEYEHHTDSDGKSGGQKEKLAYTVLAASVAYQFGLEWGETKSRSFRCVVIDEAFGKGSDESARYALHLFAKLNLQLVIVTPLTKLHIIEPYVSTVGFVTNQGGNNSVLRSLTIEAYREERERDRDSPQGGKHQEIPAPEEYAHGARKR